MNNRIIDQPARDKIINSLSSNYLVEAGAGSGKTKSLVDRMVNLIVTGTCKIHEMVAITFTRKAADELKVRFQTVLEKAWKEEERDDEKLRLELALQNIERCFLGTVHSFCARLLRERPIEAGLDINFSELEEDDDLALLEEAWQSFLYYSLEGNSGKIQELTELGIHVDTLFQCLRDMLEYPDVEWVTAAFPKPDVRTPYQSLYNLINEAIKSIPEHEPDKGYDPLQKAVKTAVKKARHMDLNRERDLIEFYELFDKNLKPTLNRWDSKEDAKFYFDKITSIFEVSIKPLLKEWKEYAHPKIVHFLRGALTTYGVLKAERSLLNFQDLLLTATELLKKNPLVRQYFQQKFRYLLIDEYQDTDPVQAELMFYLVSEDIHEQIWTNCKPRAGSLFIVGDPKQAIYRFRRADIDTYNRVKQLMEEHGGEVLQLTMNFRSLDTVTTKLNGVFANLLPMSETIYQAAYRPLNSYHKDEGTIFTGIKSLVIPSEYSLKNDIVAKDAENIAATIRSLLSEGYRPRDFMVLTRYTEGITTYANAISEGGVPVSISGEIIIGEIKEFQELVVLLKSFVDPTDEVNLIGVLRGMFFGISDEELYQWKMNGGRFSIYSEIPETLTPETKEKFAQAFAKLKLYQKWVRTLLPTTAIEKMLEDIGFYILLINSGQNKRAYRGIIQILEALRKQETSGNTTYRQITNLLVDMVNEKTVVANLEENADAVSVMNVHKAKGLEASIVFLAHPAKRVSPDSFLTKHIKREDYHSKGYFSFSVKNGNVKKDLAYPPQWEENKQEEIHYLMEEERRILYVAATRAEKALIISTSAKNDKKNPWELLLEIEGIQPIEIHSTIPEDSHEDLAMVSLTEYQNATVQANWLEDVQRNTYDHWTPTINKDFSEVAMIEREEGGGKLYGSLVHDILEKVVKGYYISDYVKVALDKYSIPSDRSDEVIAWINQFKQTRIWADLQIAQEIFTEVPFNFTVNTDHTMYESLIKGKEGGHPILVKGIIDLIYKLEDDWVIVDYKTDRPKNKEDILKLVNFYLSQLNFYKDAWQTLTNKKVKKGILYFIANDYLYINE